LLNPQKELDDNLKQKRKILLWLIKNKIRKLNDIGKVMNLYYINRDLLINNIRKNNIKEILGR
jgi:hypothetical protein